MKALSNVAQQTLQVRTAFAVAGKALESRLRAICAEQAHKGYLKSGDTIRQFGEAFEIECRTALSEIAPLRTAAERSPAMRTKLAEAIEQGILELHTVPEGRLQRIGLWNSAAADHFRERRLSLSKPVTQAVAAPPVILRARLVRWGRSGVMKIVGWGAAILGGLLVAYVAHRMGWA